MLDGFINIPEPIILPIIMEVADQKPILFAKEKDAGILGRKITKKPCQDFRALNSFYFRFHPNIPINRDIPFGQDEKLFPKGLTGRV